MGPEVGGGRPGGSQCLYKAAINSVWGHSSFGTDRGRSATDTHSLFLRAENTIRPGCI